MVLSGYITCCVVTREKVEEEEVKKEQAEHRKETYLEFES